MNSCIYEGQVFHGRKKPKINRFKYNIFMMYIDLDELQDIFRTNLFWSAKGFNIAYFRRKDYMKPYDKPLKDVVKDHVESKLGRRPEGPVRMLTHLRYFGFCFNPVTFYYCFDKAGENVDSIAAQITNTPWNERHTYVMDVKSADNKKPGWSFRFQKDFHVSPFMPLDMLYDWTFKKPGDELFVRMFNIKDDEKVFMASLRMKRKEINNRNLYLTLLKFPFMTLQVVAKIYWQALKLQQKKVPGYEHP